MTALIRVYRVAHECAPMMHDPVCGERTDPKPHHFHTAMVHEFGHVLSKVHLPQTATYVLRNSAFFDASAARSRSLQPEIELTVSIAAPRISGDGRVNQP